MNIDKTDKGRHTVWLSNEAWNKVNHHYRADNCTFQNKYIEKAIHFYTGYLDTQNASSYLPRILSDVTEAQRLFIENLGWASPRPHHGLVI